MTHHFLQVYWWSVFSLLGGLLAFMLWIQGGQSLLFFFRAKKQDRDFLVNVLGRKWELGFTLLVLFGGVAFAAFPRFYAVTFGGAYWLWTLLLISYVGQAISYEFRNKKGNVFGQGFFEGLMILNGVIATVGVGAFVSSLYVGNYYVLTESGTSLWKSPYLGLEVLAQPLNLILGLALFFLARIVALLYLAHYSKASQDVIFSNSKWMQRAFGRNVVLFFTFFLAWFVWTGLRTGFCKTGVTISDTCHFAFTQSLVSAPTNFALLGVGLVLFLFGIWLFYRGLSLQCSIISSVGVVLVVSAILLNTGIGSGVIYPSVIRSQDSLTLENSSSSFYTLNTMFYVSFLVPFVLAYIMYVWRKMDFRKLTIDEIKKNPNSY